MLSEKFFTVSDATEIESNQKKFKKIGYVIGLIAVPLDIGIAYLVSLKTPNLFWPVILIGLAPLGLMYYFVFYRGLISIKKDLSEQIKLVGELKVTSKSKQKDFRIISFDSTEVKSIFVTKESYEKIDIGDTLSIEISKYTNHKFRLSKEGQDLI
jgi:hypothetical protein